jgi:DNA ligase
MRASSLLVFLTLFVFGLFSSKAFSETFSETLGIAKPRLMLANVYPQKGSPDIKLSSYWVSEKYDGVRALWDGKRFISRQGHEYRAPQWFIADLPKIPLDGELWLGRGQFDRLSGIVRKLKPIDSEWQTVRFMVFDLPDHPGIFDQRLRALQSLKLLPIWLIIASQWRVENEAELLSQLSSFAADKAEGLMLHNGHSLYSARRSNDLLKLKPLYDQEAIVLGYEEGKGKYQGMMGALWVEALISDNDGITSRQTFKVGTGFNDNERSNPPVIGSEITFQYSGLTSQGKPRFARYWRLRQH